MEYFNSNYFSVLLTAVALFGVLPAWLAFTAKDREKLFAFVFGLFAPGFIFIVVFLLINMFTIVAMKKVVDLSRTDLWYVVYLYIILSVYYYFPKINKFFRTWSVLYDNKPRLEKNK